MNLAAQAASVRCRPARALESDRVGLQIDYHGERPPQLLLDALRATGWRAPAPATPPAEAIDWSTPDPRTGRSWSVRPFEVHGALAVPDPASPDASIARLRRVVGRLGISLDDDLARVSSLSIALSGRTSTVVGAGRDARSGRHGSREWSDEAPREPVPDRPAARTRLVNAVIRPAALEPVCRTLDSVGVLDEAMVGPTTGAGREGGLVVRYRGTRTVQLHDRLSIQVPVPQDRVDLVCERIIEACRLGAEGDGKIWVA